MAGRPASRSKSSKQAARPKASHSKQTQRPYKRVVAATKYAKYVP